MGFFRQRFLVGLHGRELRPDRAVGFAARLLQGCNLLAGLLQCVAYRLDEIFDGFLPLAQLALRLLVLHAHLLLGQAQKGLTVGLQGAVREHAKRTRQFATGCLESRIALVLQRFLVLDPVIETGVFGFQLLPAPAHDQPRKNCT